MTDDPEEAPKPQDKAEAAERDASDRIGAETRRRSADDAATETEGDSGQADRPPKP